MIVLTPPHGLLMFNCSEVVLATTYKTQEQHDVYVYVGLCVCRSVTRNSGVKSEKHFHLELIHSAAKDLSVCLYCVINGVLLTVQGAL